MVMQPSKIETRVIEAAEKVLSRQNYVNVLDLFCEMGFLPWSNFELWRKGRIATLDDTIQCGPEKRAASIEIFQKWAQQKGLRLSEAQYQRQGRNGAVNLQFSPKDDPEVEKTYRIQYLSGELTERKTEQLQERLEKAPQPIVYKIVKESTCSDCGLELLKDDLLFMDGDQPLCLTCAEFGDLEYLGAGNTALTRRSTKYSSRTAVVVHWSRSRKRYERQGILAETAAIEKAEKECLEDADERAAARARDAERRKKDDQELVVRMKDEISKLFPGCPAEEVAAIAEHTAVRGSGRVGRSEAGRSLAEDALTAAVIASIRHRHTNYDDLLAGGTPRPIARQRISDRIDQVLERWRRG
jgi:hypothetical protein